ncbi:hypothetical protein CDL12_06026 [Handroanthus impetiginosus]|uniref:Reverse transcriptase zinc-binding domain-containing protein n=1 Tax=Handroanthus impetiginosus TaxID=429701 RepID=A0A2G9HUY7_9LAMI|nr:hypothetical protein CDL12_06026 [Handroanthus impetiginosus]
MDGSSSGLENSNWKRIWKLNIPLKVKVFLWRAWWEILPTNSQLRRRHIHYGSQCPLCGNSEEIVLHALRDCPYVASVWKISELEGVDVEGNGSNVKDWLLFQKKNVYLVQLELIFMLCWAIWSNRNAVIWGKTTENKPDPATKVRSSLVEFHFRRFQHEGKHFKDRSCRKRDENWVCRWWESRSCGGIFSLEVTKAEATLLAIMVAVEKQWKENLSTIGNIIDECKYFVNCFECVIFSVVRREIKYLAHALVKVCNSGTGRGSCLPSNLIVH